MYRSVVNLDLPDSVKMKLKDFGYEYCEDLERAFTEKEPIPNEIKMIIENYRLSEMISDRTRNLLSAVDLWNSECCNPPVSVFHKEFDQLLSDGFPVGRITEICGAPGTGKTQFCLQAAVDVRIPSELGGSSGEALFISTDFGFKIERLREMARETVKHMSAVKNVKEVGKFDVETVLSGINLLKICGCRELMEAVGNLDDYFKCKREIKILIIDSFSLPLVCGLADSLERTRVIHRMIDVLLDLSIKYEFAVLVTNQLTTVIAQNSEKKFVPSLGESFGHRIHKRILLDEGKACLLKSIDKPQLFAEFRITSAGIR